MKYLAFQDRHISGGFGPTKKTTWDGIEFFFPACHEMRPNFFLGGEDQS